MCVNERPAPELVMGNTALRSGANAVNRART